MLQSSADLKQNLWNDDVYLTYFQSNLPLLSSPSSALGFGDWLLSDIGSKGSGLSRSVRRRYSVTDTMCLMDPTSCLVSPSSIPTLEISYVVALENCCAFVPIEAGSREIELLVLCFPSTIRAGMDSSSSNFEG
jgi:hypothetical protein